MSSFIYLLIYFEDRISETILPVKNQNVQSEYDSHFGQDSFKSRLSDLANKHTECQIQTLDKPKNNV